MTAAVKNIAATIEQLPAKDRAYLAERLIASLETADQERQWTREALRRRDDVRSGRVKPIPATEVYRQIDQILGR